MPNNLVVAVSTNTETFRDCRIYLMNKLKDKEKVIALENAPVEILLPHYVDYLEFKQINLMTALAFYVFDFPDKNFNDLLRITIVGCFRKLESKDLNFIPF